MQHMLSDFLLGRASSGTNLLPLVPRIHLPRATVARLETLARAVQDTPYTAWVLQGVVLI